MLACYNNFPKNVHEIKYFTTSLSTTALQQIFIETFYKLNCGTLSVEKTSILSMSEYTVVFEFGVAEGNDFNYVDEAERTRITNALRAKPFQIMDFLCVTRYYKAQDTKKRPAKFDYFMLRLIFDKKLVEARILHERGPRRVAPEEMINLTVDEINTNPAKKILKPFKPNF
jgi:hypothetical protein